MEVMGHSLETYEGKSNDMASSFQEFKDLQCLQETSE